MDRPEWGADLQLSHLATLGSALYLRTVGGDLATVAGLDNLAQALWMRLGVPQGDLAPLGHPDYGSRLHLLIGRLLTPETIALARAYVREALRKEPRIAEITSLSVYPEPTLRDTLRIDLAVRPAGARQSIALAMTFALEPGQTEAIPSATARV